MTHRGAQSISVAIGVLSATVLAIIIARPNPLTFGSSIAIWLVLLLLLDRVVMVRQGRDTVLPLSVALILALLGLIVIVDQKIIQWSLVGLSAVLFTCAWLCALFGRTGSSHTRKLMRRTTMMLWVFAAYGIVSSLYALALFFPLVPFYIIALVGAAALACIAWMIWRMYIAVSFQRAALWMAVMMLVMVEYMWVLYLLPFSFTTSGLLVVWVWYILQLFVRFHVTGKGIRWKQQRWFLLTNVVLYVVLFFFIIRWV